MVIKMFSRGLGVMHTSVVAEGHVSCFKLSHLVCFLFTETCSKARSVDQTTWQVGTD